jgi:GDP-D-mannose dehydratase
VGSPAKARDELGWVAKLKMRDVVRAMVDARRNAAGNAKT